MKPSVKETTQTALEVSIFQTPAINQLRAYIEANVELRKKVELYKRYSENLEEGIAERDKNLRLIQNYWAQREKSYFSEDSCEDDDDRYTSEESEPGDLESIDISEAALRTCDEDEARDNCDRKQESGTRIQDIPDSPVERPVESSPVSPVASPALSPIWPITPTLQTFKTSPRILQDTWVLEPGAHVEIEHAESLIMEGKMQRALAHLSTQCPSTKESSLHINATLLQSCALRSVGSVLKALELAETALYIANLNEMHQLVSKAQYHRGLAFLDLGLFADAYCCFIRAASIQWYARDVERFTREAHRKRKALPLGAKGRKLSARFQVIPTTGVSGFGAVKH